VTIEQNLMSQTSSYNRQQVYTKASLIQGAIRTETNENNETILWKQ